MTTVNTSPPASKRPVGRPPDEPKTRIRVPDSELPAVVAYLDARRAGTTAHTPRAVSIDGSNVAVIAFSSRVQAGFPSPADDYIEDVLDFNRHLIRQGHHEATFVLRVTGHSMIGAGIHDGDEIVVDRALTAKEGSIVVAVVNGEFTVKRLLFEKGLPVLMPENPHFTKRVLADGEELQIWGVVTRCLHRLA